MVLGIVKNLYLYLGLYDRWMRTGGERSVFFVGLEHKDPSEL
jgi:hypothetical protein